MSLFTDFPPAPPLRPEQLWRRADEPQPAQAPAIDLDLAGTPEEREAFATAILRNPSDPMGAARAAIGDEAGPRLYKVASLWANDKTTRDLKAELVEAYGEEHFLPSKAQIAREVYDHAARAYDPEVAFKGYKLYAEIMGHVSKPTIVNNNSNAQTRNVLIIQDKGTDAEWAERARLQQARLAADASE